MASERCAHLYPGHICGLPREWYGHDAPDGRPLRHAFIPAPSSGAVLTRVPMCLCAERWDEHHPECPVLAHDAALRARAEKAERERDEAHRAMIRLNKTALACADAAEAERDRLREALRVVRDANTIMRAKLEANRALAEIEKEENRDK